jgi:TolB-like protein
LRFLFGDHVLDTARRELRRGGERIAMEPQVFDLLVYLLQNRERVVSKDDLLASVWGGRIVSDATLDSRIAAARRAVGDSGAAQTLIRTFARKGVRFVGAVREERKPAASALEMVAEPERLLALPDKPSIAVLPFANLSGDSEQEYFVDGMVEEIITALARIRWLFVIARNSSFTYKGQATDVRRVGRELGVRYVLEGSVRRGGNRVRISAQLIEAETGAHLWADRFDGSLEDVFDLQDKVATSVAGVIEPTLQAAETARSARRPTRDLSAYDAYLRAFAMYFTSPPQIREALALLEEAIGRDPQYGPALGFAGLCCHYLATDGSAPDREAIRQKGIEFGRRAVEVGGDDPGVLTDAAMALAVFGEDIDAMMLLVDRALALNPGYARGWLVSGFLRLWAGRTDLAIEHAAMARRLSPRAQAGMTSFLIGAATFFSRRFEEAIPRLRVAIEDTPAFHTPYRFLAACCAHAGLLDEARTTIERLRAITPEIMVNYSLPFRDPQHRDLYFSGLRLAMGETA